MIGKAARRPTVAARLALVPQELAVAGGPL